MPFSTSDPKNPFFRARSMRVSPPWELLLLEVSGFPIKEAELGPIKTFLQKLTQAAATRWKLDSEMFIQVEQSDEPDGRALYVKHARRWIPEIGLGVWPDREPPIPWTKEEFTSLQPGDTLRPLMYQVFRVSTAPQFREEAHDVLLAFGPMLRVMTTYDSDTYLQIARDVLLPPITDPSFTCFPFYVPLLDLKGLTSGDSAKLEAWLSGATLYIRESFEDKGILIASRELLAPLLEDLGCRFVETPEPCWEIPI